MSQAREVNMPSELKRIEKSVNVLVGKPVTWAVYGLLLAGRYAVRGAISAGRWLRTRYAASAGKPALGTGSGGVANR
jgi:uncharacterized membrane protein YhfC